jgi:hypothetical protein
MKEKVLMTTFALANLADAALTRLGMSMPGFKDINNNPIVPADALFSSTESDRIFIAKWASMTILLGVYALAARHNGRWKWPAEKAIQIGNAIMVGVVAWNLVNIGLAVTDKIK